MNQMPEISNLEELNTSQADTVQDEASQADTVQDEASQADTVQDEASQGNTSKSGKRRKKAPKENDKETDILYDEIEVYESQHIKEYANVIYTGTALSYFIHNINFIPKEIYQVPYAVAEKLKGNKDFNVIE